MAKSINHQRNCINAANRFINNKAHFEDYNGFEDWYLDASEKDEIATNRELTYLDAIKRHFNIELRKKDYFISSSALDEIIFHCIQNSNPEEFIADVLSHIELYKLNGKSVVIFPVHNFGFQFIGFNNLFNRALTTLSYDNFLITTQTNSLTKTMRIIDDFLRKKIEKRLDQASFDHYYKSRSLKWLESNPLLLFSFNFSQLNPYENLAIILEKLSHFTNQLYFLAVLRSGNSDVGRLFSTKQMNNWETLDLKHFLTINGFNNKILCKPIHYKYDLLFNEMHLNIDLLATNKSIYQWEKEAINCLDEIYEGNKSFLLTKHLRYSVHHKISNSLKYFRRSLKSVNVEDKIININIAIEALLLDNEGDKVRKIFVRLAKSLKYYRDKSAALIEVDKVIKERNNIVHNATIVTHDINFTKIYRMYCKVVAFLTKNIGSIDGTKPNKMSIFFEST
ncbi:HEPN domain-containing protein [Taibaiella chishuiensis]|uniref:Uncharacterized protein n=1 Tax=Taibaiella chishuiensis TaxID=1434707 RepID=A0A2P8D2U6_9BACT|nr:HEPN domain-containing protein [Taibaiella chishuiensis]PSK91552.1 hypothetical protein B0I18_105135 [Taibaiella chishuiensis]